MPSPPVFAARRLTKQYGRLTVLDGLDLSLEHGRCHVLFGRNGAGKSTLLRIAATLVRPTSGELLYDGKPVTELGPALRSRIGLVSHQSFLYPNLTVLENLRFYAELYGLSVDVTNALDVADLTLRRHTPTRSLSRGMHQRLAIARALLHEPRLLLLDEPFTGLDTLSMKRLTRLLGEIRDGPTTILMTTHDVERGLVVSDRSLVMEAGRIVFDATGGTADEVHHILSKAPELIA